MSDSRLKRIEAAYEKAKTAFNDALMSKYPPGSAIRFKIMSGQINLSSGTVYSPGWRPGYVRVKHDQAKEFSRYAFRDVHYEDIAR